MREDLLMRLRLGSLVLVLLAAACGGRQARMNTEIRRGPMPEGGTWAGVWLTNWGQMSLSTQGSATVGEFCEEQASRYGRLEGTAQGNAFSFHWTTTDVTMAGRPRRSEGSGIVQFSFLNAGEMQQPHFEGTWGYEASNADGGPLRGDRSARYSDLFLRGAYTIACPIRDEAEQAPPLTEDDVGDNPELEGDEGGEADEGSGEAAPEEGGAEQEEGPLDL
jgi:hypothetical protein